MINTSVHSGFRFWRRNISSVKMKFDLNFRGLVHLCYLKIFQNS